MLWGTEVQQSLTVKSCPSGCMRFSPAGLQHRLSAELNYLTAIEESVRQLSDVERVRGISLAQQESVSLAQILKVVGKIFPCISTSDLINFLVRLKKNRMKYAFVFQK